MKLNNFRLAELSEKRPFLETISIKLDDFD